MPLSDYLVGLGFFAGTVGGALLTAGLLLRRFFPALPPGPAVVAFGTLVTAVIVAVHLVPAMLGVLAREAALGAAVIAAGVAWRWRARAAPAVKREAEPGAPGSALSWLVAAAGIAAPTVYLLALARDRLARPISSVDALNFHFPQVGRWMETGSVWQVDNLIPGWAFGNYPNTGNLVQLATTLPWDNDSLVRFATYPFLVLAGLTVYIVACELGAPRAASAIFAALFAALPTVAVIAADHGMPDAIMLAGFGAGALFLLRHARTGRAGELVLAGLGLGIALGTKWYGLSAAVAAGVVWAAARLAARHGPRTVARQAALLAGAAAAMGGVWLLRNLLLSGNPVFPVKVAPLGITLFDAPPDPIRERAGFALTEYLGDPGLWEDAIVPQLLDSFGLAGPLLAGAAVAALVLAAVARRRGEPGSGRVLAVAAAALLLLAVYAATPYTAFGPEGRPLLVIAATRYAGPAVLLCAALAAWVAGRLGRAGLALELAALVLVAEALSRYGDFGIRDFDIVSARALAEGVAGVAVLGAGVAVVRAARRRRLPGWALAAACAVLAAGLAAAGHRQQRSFNDGRYAGVNPVYDWVRANAPAGRRVGLAGLWPDVEHPPPWVMFGPRLGNHVEYVGPVVRERLERHSTATAFADAVRRARLDLLLVGLGGPGQPVSEDEWARAAGWTPVAEGGGLLLLAPPR